MASVEGSAGNRLRILVVEDEYLIAENTADMLESLGAQRGRSRTHIAEALAAIASERMDAALLDANLSGTSSAPIAAALVTRRVPFVVVTGYGNLELVDAALQGAPRISKPVTTDDLAAILAKTVTPLKT